MKALIVPALPDDASPLFRLAAEITTDHANNLIAAQEAEARRLATYRDAAAELFPEGRTHRNTRTDRNGE